jgi:hypothetical protein
MTQHRLYNLIEHLAGTDNRYLLMDATEGNARSRSQLVPDSPDWFAWLAGLSSFHFKGKGGHFTARQERKQRRETYWYAYRKAHKRRLKRYLGTTGKLTLAHLEQTACALHEAVLGAIPEDEALNARSKAPLEGLKVGPLTVLWHQGVLSIKTPTEHHFLNKTQTTELLSYLYARRGTLLKSDG